MLEQILQPVPLVLLVIIVIMAVALLRLNRILKQRNLVNLSNQTDAQMETQVQSTLRANEADQRFLSKADEALRLTQTFQKFVPRQFVEHFAKHGSDTLELGRADEDEVAILFSDIRGFTGLSEKMTPQELMKFLNSYFLRMNDPIHQNGGFIDKFIGDAIMALFDHPNGSNQDKAIDALNAALDLRYALNVYNQHRSNSGYPPINIGVGIHFGPVIIGTVGSDDRMDTTVIGDSVNIAYRLESLAPKLGADIIVSSQLLATADAKAKFTYRLLDWVRVKGRKNPVEVYEILNHLPEQSVTLKLKTAPWIEKGVNYRKSQQWNKALSCFEKARLLNPNDHLVAHHIEQCHALKNTLVPANWDGAAEL
ncbi:MULTISPECIES: adenylate/guanylate cyclase domain-containing protein [Alteromonadaceae]|uniref:adenylate/guanylate cyclase domain-containing protein n=1 Tax=Alteromonadaceae TaxID=72275 RepID=UPI001C093D34|nr:MULTISPECIES: adenylate/guanylate cyclase domain-containing protein [Aliiglaciecola]MBU2878560.1 tetratricopeptide repeat protein [Aliiglaciecola lipolytica]MDO6709612.1 adenylate/guanylate cyclase domain-containing protein [Aliiglaciecola sp. 2_MG-2023]MDO6750846.1 adenylate/guanylate cyclase domain-containing protein [Aliiglaciecola sp. 1_MG-2023]